MSKKLFISLIIAIFLIVSSVGYAIFQPLLNTPSITINKSNLASGAVFQENNNNAAMHTGEICNSCKGYGWSNQVVCLKCEGYGVLECNECNSEGTDRDGNICPECHGTGKIICQECKGTGGTSCNSCNGDGYYDTENIDK